MPESVNWIHLTDLHLGLDDHSWLWPKVKHDLYKDIERLADQVDGWDLVFFTGDLTQKGDKTEFDRLNKELEDLWKVLAKSGRTPLLCVVPGNHDLTRPQSDLVIAKTFTQLWWKDPDLRSRFWSDRDCECRKAVEDFFRNYTNWASKLSVPTLEVSTGILPGDFSATFTKGTINLGIIGLNSTFLQIAAGDFKGKLDLHVSQMNAVCGGDPEAWLEQKAASVLLTHQPPSWLAPEALEHFRQEIYLPGRFLAQLCGHQHEPEAFELSEAGGAPRRLRQSPSVFGLESWEGPSPSQRIHGYTGGQYVFEGSSGFEKLWPRTTVKGRHGGLNLCPDHTYRLQEGDCVVTRFDLGGDEGSQASSVTPADSGAEPAQSITPPKLELQLLDQPPDEQTAKARLASCPRLGLSVGPQHRFVRQEEGSQFEHELRKSRCVWLVADWGTERDGFLAASLERFRTEDLQIEVFHLRCDDASDVDGLEALFPQQFGMPLQTFCRFTASLKGAFLVFDGIHPSLCTGDNLQRLRRIASAIVDYCPELRLVLVSRLGTDGGTFPTIVLRPLDAPDVRTYIMHHPDATGEVPEPDVIEKLHERSEGLPMHLDRILKALKVSSLASVLEADLEGPLATDGTPEATPKALVRAVSSLTKCQDKLSKRSFRLLQVLSVLPYGETLEVLHHLLPTEPFFYQNALQLNELALLDVIPLQQTTPQVGVGRLGLNEQSAPKILKVPRQVRDFVQTLLSDDERAEIVLAGVERFFGRGWREGKVKLRSLPVEYREYLGSGAGNEFAVIHHLIVYCRNKGDDATVQRAAQLGIQYVRHLGTADRYRDLVLVAGSLLQTIDRDGCPVEWCRMAALLGGGLRMTGKHMEALGYLKGALEAGDEHLQRDEKASTWLNIARAEERLNKAEAAVAAAEKVKQHAKPDSGSYIHALSIVAGLTLKGADKAKQLTELEKLARDKGYATLADTIALELANKSESPREVIRLLDSVLATNSRGYNQARAVVAKAEAVQRLEKPVELKAPELLSLSAAYSYLHSQRLGSLFERCHEALWRVFEAKGDTSQLLRLFRHTSFVWRIRGDETREAEYLKRLSERNVPQAEVSGSLGVVIEVRYFWNRLKVVIVKAATPSS